MLGHYGQNSVGGYRLESGLFDGVGQMPYQQGTVHSSSNYHNPNDQEIAPGIDIAVQAGGYPEVTNTQGIRGMGLFEFDDRRPDRIGPVPGTGTYEGSLLFYHEEIGGERIGFCVGFITTLPQYWGSHNPSRCGIFSRCTTHDLGDFSKGSLNILNNCNRYSVLKINYHEKVSSGISGNDALNSGENVIQIQGGHYKRASSGENLRGIFDVLTIFPSNNSGGTTGSPH